MKKLTVITILLLSLTGCSDSDTFEDVETTPTTGTNPGTGTTPGTDPTASISYSKNVKAIIDGNCISCHSSGRAASFRPLTTYAEVKAAVENAGLLNRIQLQSGQQGLMPQGGRMSQANIDLVVKWNTDGLKEN